MEILQNNVDLVILIGLSIIGLVVIFYNIDLINKGRKTQMWKEASGRIIKSELEISKSPTERTFDNHYRADIDYSYQIGEDSYFSNQVHLGDKVYLPNKDKAEKILNKFQIGKEVSVYYNPQNISESILIKGSGANRFFNIALGLLAIILGALIQSYYEELVIIVKSLEQ